MSKHRWRKKPRGIVIRNIYRKRTDDLPPPQPNRPLTRGDCHRDSGTMNARRPCPWVGCRYHLLIDATEVGSIRSQHATLEQALDKIDTCALDIAEDNPAGMTSERIGNIFGITGKAILIIIERALEKLRGTHETR